MKRIKNILLVSLIVMLTITLTGCSSENKSAESVATAMVEKLSTNDYTNIIDLYYHKDSYVSDASFKRLMEYEELNISGNQKIKVKSVGEKYKDENDFYAQDVVIEIDNNRLFKLHTIEVDNKWYVYDPSFVSDENIKIIVPEGAKVALDGKEIDDSYLTDEKKITFEYYYSDVEIEAPVDIYVLPAPIKGAIAITITNGSDTINDAIGYHSADLDITTGEYDFTDTYEEMIYDFYIDSAKASDSTEKLVSAFVGDYLTNVYASLNNLSDYSTVSSYYDSENELIFKTSYNDVLKTIYNPSNPTLEMYEYSYYNLAIKYYEIDDVYQIGDRIIVGFEYRVTYDYKYLDYDEEETNSSYDYNDDVLTLEKSGNTYKIVNAENGIGGLD